VGKSEITTNSHPGVYLPHAQTTDEWGEIVKIFASKRTNASPAQMYATDADFCRIFEDDMDGLYQLSLLLTANSELAEKCFVRGLEGSKSSNPVFKEWAQAWARRAVIINAIRMIGPRPGIVSVFDRSSSQKAIKGLSDELAAVVDLPAFERFVFVMSVLEGYPARDCRLLLNCSNFDIAEARVRALQRLGKSAEIVRQAARAAGSHSNSEDSKPGDSTAHFAASA
jgi:DNA-directed RNA polymerase specialized sigma24 family protein